MIETTIRLKPEAEWPAVTSRTTTEKSSRIANARRTTGDAMNDVVQFPPEQSLTMPLRRALACCHGIKTPIASRSLGDLPRSNVSAPEVEAFP